MVRDRCFTVRTTCGVPKGYRLVVKSLPDGTVDVVLEPI